MASSTATTSCILFTPEVTDSRLSADYHGPKKEVSGEYLAHQGQLRWQPLAAYPVTRAREP